MAVLGIVIGLGAALAFVAIGVISALGGLDATRNEILRSFRPDSPSGLERALTFVGVWGPVLLVVLLCLLAGVQIARVVLAAL